jgi:hypothetical protein
MPNTREKLIELLEDIGASCDVPIKVDADGCGIWDIMGADYIADCLIANGVTVQEWISVKDRLPDWRDGKVLVFTKYGFSICERTVNNRWQGQHANWITHWSYLPQPPKGE